MFWSKPYTIQAFHNLFKSFYNLLKPPRRQSVKLLSGEIIDEGNQPEEEEEEVQEEEEEEVEEKQEEEELVGERKCSPIVIPITFHSLLFC